MMLEQYIEMCRNAIEINELWEIELGDLFVYTKSYGNKHIGDVGVVSFFCAHPKHSKEIYITDFTNTAHGHGIHRCVWLPRQYQLQKMFLDKCTPHQLCLIFEGWRYDILEKIKSENVYAREKEYSQSFEMLWLRFVMHKKFNKTWTGSDWALLSVPSVEVIEGDSKT